MLRAGVLVVLWGGGGGEGSVIVQGVILRAGVLVAVGHWKSSLGGGGERSVIVQGAIYKLTTCFCPGGWWSLEVIVRGRGECDCPRCNMLRAGVLVVLVIGGHCRGGGRRGECNCPRSNNTCLCPGALRVQVRV